MTNFINPAPGARFTSAFGDRTLKGKREKHYGIDLAQSGKVPILASAAGTVIRAGVLSTYGKVVFIQHSINGKPYDTVYAHLSEIHVKLGDKVKQGQAIGLMGNTGRSYGQHLHFEIHDGPWVTGRPNAVDPYPLIHAKKPDATLYRVLGSVVAKDAAEKAMQKVVSKTGWLVHVVQNGDKYQIKTGTFKGKDAGGNAAEMIRELGFKATPVKA